MPRPLISLRNLEKTCPLDRGCFHVLRRIDLSVEDGDFVSILGSSGAGKTSLLHILGLIDDDWSGSYRFRGGEVARLSPAQRQDLQRREVGFVFQVENLLGDLTVAENLELPLLYRDVGYGDRRRRVVDVLEAFQLDEVLGWRPVRLSPGQRLLVGLARALIGRPALLLADEPTGGLSDSERRRFLQTLRRVNLEGATVVLATRSEAVAACTDRVVRLSEGWLDGGRVEMAGMRKGVSQ